MKQRASTVVLAAAIGGILGTAARAPAAGEEVRVGAGAAPSENIFAKIKKPMLTEIGLRLQVLDNGPVEGFKALDAGKVDAAAGGLTFPDWMALLEKEGLKVPDPSAYKFRVIGKDIVKVIVHPDLKIAALSKDQLQGLFTGKTQNWKEVGGPDIAVTVISGSEMPGTYSVFQKQVMDGEKYSTKAVAATKSMDVKAKVIATRGALGLAPLSLADSAVGTPQIPEVGRPITLITKGAPNAQVLKMLDYLSGAGKKYLTK